MLSNKNRRILPLMLEQCKLKTEDFKKFKRDQAEADVLESNKEKVRMTIRSKAAKVIEAFSGKRYNANTYYRNVSRRGLLGFEADIGEIPAIHIVVGRKVNYSPFFIFSYREAAILVLGIICGF